MDRHDRGDLRAVLATDDLDQTDGLGTITVHAANRRGDNDVALGQGVEARTGQGEAVLFLAVDAFQADIAALALTDDADQARRALIENLDQVGDPAVGGLFEADKQTITQLRRCLRHGFLERRQTRQGCFGLVRLAPLNPQFAIDIAIDDLGGAGFGQAAHRTEGFAAALVEFAGIGQGFQPLAQGTAIVAFEAEHARQV